MFNKRLDKYMQILMIHECDDRFLELDLSNYLLTFDDGLYTQYNFYKKIKHLPNKKIFFISTNIICNGTQSTEYISCRDAHQKAFDGNNENYMTIDQIRTLMKDPLVEIGGHSHSHTRLKNFNSLLEKVEYIKQDTSTMLEWFLENLNLVPKSFCFPYNDSLDGFYKGLVEREGITTFYGKERIPIETLLHN